MPRAPKPRTIRDAAYVTWVHGQPCIVCGRPGDACHVHTRRNGGDRRNLVPLCRAHHREQHTIGIVSFARRYNLNLAASADEFDRRYHSPPW